MERQIHQAMEAVRAWIEALGRARATTTWLAIVTATQLILHHTSPRLETALLRSVSTNLHNLRTDPLDVLITSACFVETQVGYVVFVLACLALLAPLEAWLGTRRWLIGLVIGHIGSTLIVALGLWIAAIGHVDEARTIDVGVSYGVSFLGTMLVFRLQGWPRWLAGGGVLAVAVGALAYGQTFTDWGHLTAVVLALAIGRLLLPRGAAPSSATAAGAPRRVQRPAMVAGESEPAPGGR